MVGPWDDLDLGTTLGRPGPLDDLVGTWDDLGTWTLGLVGPWDDLVGPWDDLDLGWTLFLRGVNGTQKYPPVPYERSPAEGPPMGLNAWN